MKHGFTLIELLVVVLIIGILAAIALPQYTQSVYKARYTQLMVIGKAITDAEERYYLSEGKYTSDLTELDITVPTGKYIVSPDVRADGFAALWARPVPEALALLRGTQAAIIVLHTNCHNSK